MFRRDKRFLRSENATQKLEKLKNLNGLVIMYIDNLTKSMKLTIDEAIEEEKQDDYNKKHNIIPKPIIKNKNIEISESLNHIHLQICRQICDEMDNNELEND